MKIKKVTHKLGATRHRTKFLWLPLEFNGYLYWLEYVTLVEKYNSLLKKNWVLYDIILKKWVVT